MLANPPLQEAVIAILERDPRVPDPLTIAVAAQGDVVALRGKVETFRERHAAIDDARQVDGVREIDGYVEYDPQRVAAYDDVATLERVMGIDNEITILGY